MSIFNVRLSKELEAALSERAKERRCGKSELAREAIAAYFAKPATNDAAIEANDPLDDWADFGAAVIAAQQQALKDIIAKLYDAEWEHAVEPLYALFREKVIAKVKGYEEEGDPLPFLTMKDPSKPYLASSIPFAADDDYSWETPLEELFYRYGVHAGDDAFNEIPKIWERARERLMAEDGKLNAIADARITRPEIAVRLEDL